MKRATAQRAALAMSVVMSCCALLLTGLVIPD